jgi:exosortase
VSSSLILESEARPSQTRRTTEVLSPAAKKIALCTVAVQLAFIYAPTVNWLVDRWTMSVWHNAHGLLIPPVVGYFVYQELRRVRHLPAEGSAWGFAFLIPALLLHALDMGIHTQLLSAISLVLILPGLALLFLGRARTRAIAFPLAFSVFMLPIPLAMTERLHLALREIATLATTAVLPLLGIAAYSEGTTIHLAEQTLAIGDGCSGFSTLYAACAVAALTAYSCPDVRRRIAVLVFAAPIAIAANVLRVILLVAVVEWRGEAVLASWVHPASGMLTFALSLPLIFWIGSNRQEQQ